MADRIKVRYVTEHGYGFVTEYKPEIAERLLDRGAVELVDDEQDEAPPKISAGMKRNELAEIATERGIDIKGMTKKQILEALQEQESEDEDGEDPGE